MELFSDAVDQGKVGQTEQNIQAPEKSTQNINAYYLPELSDNYLTTYTLYNLN